MDVRLDWVCLIIQVNIAISVLISSTVHVYMSLGQPLSFWQKPRILAVISCLMFLPYNEFCRSIGTDYIAKEKENLSLSIFFFIGIGLAWHDELDTLPAACRNCLLPATASVVTNRKVLIIVKQEVDYVALLTSSVAPTSMLTIAVRPLTTSMSGLRQSNISGLVRDTVSSVYCCAFCTEAIFSYIRT